MPKVHPIITSFAAGEWSPFMEGRVDLEQRRQAAQLMENFFSTPQGPAVRRPGFRFIAPAKYAGQECRLVDFVYSNEQAYVLEFGNSYLRFFANQGQILSGGVPYEIETPYEAADLKDLVFISSADIVYILHPNYWPRKLSRYNNTNWTLTQVEFSNGPYLDMNSDITRHLIPSGVDGSITVKAQRMYIPVILGTWSGAAASDAAVMTPTTPYGGFRFAAPNDGTLQTVKIEIKTASTTTPNTAQAFIYSQLVASPGTLLATSTGTIDLTTTGEKTWTFPAVELSAGASYWVVFSAATAEANIRIAQVAADAAYGSGSGAAILSLTDSGGADFKVDLAFQRRALSNIFDEGHVDSVWRVRHTGHTVSKVFTLAGDTSDALELSGDFTVDITVDTSWTGRLVLQKSTNFQASWFDVATFSTSTKQAFSEDKPGCYYRFKCMTRSGGTATANLVQLEQWGVFRITDVVSAAEVVADVLSPLGATDPSPFWMEGAWSDYRGFPSCGCFDETDRLEFAGSRYQPLTRWKSATGDYENFAPGSGTADAAYTTTLNNFKNPIQWVSCHTAELIGTLGEEGWVQSAKSESLSAANPGQASIQSTFGTKDSTQPISVGPAILFIQSGGRVLRRLGYNFNSNAFLADDLTFLADHVTAGGIKGICYQQNPYSIVWAWTVDGKLISMTHAQIADDYSKAWHRHPLTNGMAKSMCCIPSAFDGAEGGHEVWASIRRVIGGEVVHYIEMLEDNSRVTEAEDYFYVDSGLTYEGVAVSALSGLDHLEGQAVVVWANGAPMSARTVENGAITLDYPVTKAHVGLPYTSKLSPMKIEAGAADGTAQGRTKEIAGVILRVKDSMFGKVGSSESDLIELSNWVIGEYLLGDAPALFSGDLVSDGWPGDASREGNILIVQDLPAPLTVLAVVATVVTHD